MHDMNEIPVNLMDCVKNYSQENYQWIAVNLEWRNDDL